MSSQKRKVSALANGKRDRKSGTSFHLRQRCDAGLPRGHNSIDHVAGKSQMLEVSEVVLLAPAGVGEDDDSLAPSAQRLQTILRACICMMSIVQHTVLVYQKQLELLCNFLQ